MIDYPKWACVECGKKHGTKMREVSCWHYGKCDVCHTNKNVTEVRDYGHFPRWFDVEVKKKTRNKK